MIKNIPGLVSDFIPRSDQNNTQFFHRRPSSWSHIPFPG